MSRSPETQDELDRMRHCATALSIHDGSALARRLIAPLKSAFAGEIDMLIIAGEIDDARHRIHRFLNPKFASVAECAEHVGNPHHLDQPKSRSML